MTNPIQIGSRLAGPGQPCFVIAEAGVNHNGSVDLAIRLVDAAAAAGADAVKFQSFRAEEVAGPEASKAAYQRTTSTEGESQLDMLRRLELSDLETSRIKDYCDRKGILFLSSPFDRHSVDLLAALGVAAFKIASGEVDNHPMLAEIAAKGRPVILSTGMCTLKEVGDAVEVLRRHGGSDLILLHCVSNYPAAPEDCNLSAMRAMSEAFGVPVGFSDHTEGIEVGLAAAALGACVIEKHLTLDRGMAGPDHRASLEPGEMTAFIAGIRVVERALGNGEKAPARCEEAIMPLVRRSLVLRTDVEPGGTIEPAMLVARRPAGGISPSRIAEVVGRRAARGLAANTVLRWSDLD